MDTAIFGRTLAIDDQTMVVGSRFADGNGWVAHVYQRGADSWDFLTQLTSPLGVNDSLLEVAVAASADAVFVGERSWDVGSFEEAGGVHIFEWRGAWPIYRTTIAAPNPGDNDHFGTALDTENDLLVVGAPQYGPQNHGAVFVFRRSDSGWELESTLTPPTTPDGRFGAVVELTGNTLFVGAPWEDIAVGRGRDEYMGAAGAVHVFTFVGGTWKWQQRLTAEIPSKDVEFGNAIACDGELAVIAAWNEGAAYVFRLQDDTWQQAWHIKPESYFGGFGTAVDIQDGHVLIGAPGGSGECFVFSPLDDAWTLSGMLLQMDGDYDAKFGCAVAFDGEEVVIGARGQDVPGSIDEGAVYVYRHNLDDAGCEPVASGLMQPSDLAPDHLFGASLACDEERAIVGAPGKDSVGHQDAGAAYIFRPFASTWIQDAKLIAPNASHSGHFGSSVAIQGAFAVAGGKDADGSGAAYVYRKVPGGEWSFDQKLVPDAPWGGFGASVVLSDDFQLLVGAPGEPNPDGFNGAVYVFELVDDDWVQSDRLTTTGLLPIGGNFGESIAVDGEWLAIGAPSTFDEYEAAGAVCLFRRTEMGWIEHQKLFFSDPFEQAFLGRDLDLVGNTLVATIRSCIVPVYSYDGDEWTEETSIVPSLCLGIVKDCSLSQSVLLVATDLFGLGFDSPSVFVFLRQGGQWIQRGKIDSPFSQGGGWFGEQLTHNHDQILVAAPGSDVILTDPPIEAGGVVFAYEVPDDCDEDCNESGLADSTDISSGASEDCNGNGMPDECDLANQVSADCNGDGVPDECQDALVSFDSTAFAPLLAGINHSVLITSSPPPIGDVILSFSASGDLAFSSENIAVDLNGVSLGVLWGTFGSGADCSTLPLAATIVVPLATWQAAVGARDAKITMTPSAGVDSAACTDGSFISCTTSYTALAGLDRDSDGIIDSCNRTKTTREDLDGDGDVDGFDLALLLGQWTGAASYAPCPPTHAADLNGDCTINGFDLATLLGAWG